MKSKNVLIETTKLKPGLYISGLDRPWSETPLFSHGFWIEDKKQIEQLQQLCNSVFVDVGRSKEKFNAKKIEIPNLQLIENEKTYKTKVIQDKEVARNISTYTQYTPLKSSQHEFAIALVLHEKIETALDQARDGYPEVTELKDLANELVTTIKNNADAISLSTRVGEPPLSIQNLVIRIAIWSVLFGITLGKNKETLNAMVLAALLCKIGFTRNQRDIDALVTHTLTNHLERYDGSGHPGKLAGSKIPLSAQIIGIAEYYECLVSTEFTKNPLSPTDAIHHLQSLRGIKFSASIVDQFTHMLGLYPTGSLVLLNTDEIAIVAEQRANKRLTPVVVIVTKASGEIASKQLRLDLTTNNERFIKKSLPSNRLNVDLSSLISPKTWWRKFLPSAIEQKL